MTLGVEALRGSGPVQWQALEERVEHDGALHIGYLQIGAQRLRVAVRTPRAAAARRAVPLLLFNGIGANLELAVPLMAALGDTPTIIFDVPGAGHSPAPQWPYRMHGLVRLTEALLDRLQVCVVDVLGVSWGGAPAQQFALSAAARTRKLVLAATSCGALMVPAHPRVLLRMIDARRYSDVLYMHSHAAELYGGDMQTNPRAARLFAQHARGGSRTGYQYQLLAVAGWTSLPWLHQLRQPTLVLAGDDDPIVPLVNGRILARLIPNARLHVFSGGHVELVTEAGSLAPVVSEFLLEG